MSFGNPRIDMWKANSYGLFNRSKQEIKKKYEKFALLPFNFYPYTVNAIQSSNIKENYKITYKEWEDRSEFLFDKSE